MLTNDDFHEHTFPLIESIFQFDAIIDSCGYSVVRDSDPRRYMWNGLERGNSEFVIWQYTISGLGELSYEGKIYPQKKGDLMLLHLPYDNCYYLPEKSPEWQFLYISIRGKSVMRNLLNLEKKIGAVHHLSIESNSVKKVIELIKAAQMGEMGSSYIASSWAYQAYMAIVEDLSYLCQDNQMVSNRMKLVHDYILKNIAKELNVSILAKVAGYSRFHFSRMFSKTYGISPAQYLKDLRISLAVKYLQMSLFSIKEISVLCGFSDTSYFCKVFSKKHGASPNAFREK